MSETKGIVLAPQDAALGAEIVPAEKFEGADQLETATTPQKIGGVDNLTELGKHFVFFTTGLLFTHGGLDRDPVQEFMNEAEGEPQIALMSFDRPVFEGFQFKDGRRDWNHKLLAIERSRWDDLHKFLSGVCILDSRNKVFYRVLPFSVMVADPVIMDRAAVIQVPLPTVEVVVYGLDGNIRKVLVRSPSQLGLQVPTVVTDRPDPKTVEYANKLFQGKDPGEAPDSETAKLFEKMRKGG